MNNIELKNVNKNYPGFTLKNITFNVPKGAIVGLIGENGAGKTTTIKAILNITKTTGEIKVLNKHYKDLEREIKEELGVVLDDSFISEYISPKSINSIMKSFYKSWDSKKYFSYLETFGLPENKTVKNFSSGMKMKLKLITALSHPSKILILDEPTSGLDPVVRSEILDLLRNYILEDEERSILLSSHITSDLEHIADYIIFISNGEVKLNKETEYLLENYGVAKVTEEEYQKISKEDYLYSKKEKYHYLLLVDNKVEFKKKYKVTIERVTIEDIMLFYLKGEK